MNLLFFIQSHHLQNYIYLVIFLGMFTDAAIVVFAAVFLISVNAIGVVPGLIILLLGIFAEQLGFYWVGLRLSRHSAVSRWADRLAKPFDRHLLSRPFRTLLVSKFVYGLHRAMLVRSGMLKLSFKKFIKYAAYNSIIWLVIVGGLGVAFAGSYVNLKKYFRYAEIIPLGLVALYVLIDWRLSSRLKKEI